MGELNYWTDLMTRWGVRRIADSDRKAHGKMASLIAQRYNIPPDFDEFEFPSRNTILFTQKSVPQEYERS
jgi:hypothetical protein